MALMNWLGGAIRRLRGEATRLRANTQGNVAMMMALCMPVVVMITLGGIDIHRASTVRMNLQDALDAAALAAARSPYTAAVDIQRVGMAALKANLKAFPDVALDEAATTFTLQNNEIVIAKAHVNVKAIVANIILPPYGKLLDDVMPVGASSEVNRATKDLEVSLVLDITGSMGQPMQRMTDLQAAANELIDLVVQPNQNINKTRMALVPYSMGVNAGTHLNQVRGAAVGPKNISGAAWSSWSSKTIGSMTKASPGVLTVTSHGFNGGEFVWVSGVGDDDGTGSDLSGWLNNKPYRVKKVGSNTISLESWNGSAWAGVTTSGYETYTANSGKVQRCTISTCEVVVTTSADHLLNTNDDVRITGVGGMTQINTYNDVSRTSTTQPPLGRAVTKLTNTTFYLNGVNPADSLSTYTSGGQVQCLEYGCRNYLFTNNSGSLRVFGATNCVTERTGANAYTDVSAATSPVAFSYTGTDDVGQGGCMQTTFTPLTSDKSALHTAINGYTPEGGTAGQIGIAWGWYMVSPSFISGTFLPNNRPDPYGTRSLLKVVIIMTDGEFNAVHYDGVRARDSGTGGGTNDRWINHNSTNGSPFLQSARLCDKMKEQNIIIYTVGFDISEQSDSTPNKALNNVDTAQDVMEYCATDAEHVYLPQSGSSLKDAFGAIGRSISRLKISK